MVKDVFKRVSDTSIALVISGWVCFVFGLLQGGPVGTVLLCVARVLPQALLPRHSVSVPLLRFRTRSLTRRRVAEQIPVGLDLADLTPALHLVNQNDELHAQLEAVAVDGQALVG